MPATEVAPGVFRVTDTCNAYVVRDGDAALLIDFGDGAVVGELAALGVTRVEWVLFTPEGAVGRTRRRPAVMRLQPSA